MSGSSPANGRALAHCGDLRRRCRAAPLPSAVRSSHSLSLLSRPDRTAQTIHTRHDLRVGHVGTCASGTTVRASAGATASLSTRAAAPASRLSGRLDESATRSKVLNAQTDRAADPLGRHVRAADPGEPVGQRGQADRSRVQRCTVSFARCYTSALLGTHGDEARE